MKRTAQRFLTVALFVTILLTSAKWSFAQTATPTPTATVTATPTVTPTQTPGPEIRIGAVQANQSGGLSLEASTGDEVLKIGEGDTRTAHVTGDLSVDGSVTSDVKMTDGKRLAVDRVDAVDATGIPFYDKDGNWIVTFTDTNSVRFGSPEATIGLLLNNTYVTPLTSQLIEAAEIYTTGANYTSGSYNVGLNVYASGASTDAAVDNIGCRITTIGAAGNNAAAYIWNAATATGTQYGAFCKVSGTGPTTGYALWSSATNATNPWALWCDAGNTHLAGYLELVDSAQRISVNTTNNTVTFGNGTTSDFATIDCDDGTITTAGKINLGAGSALTISTGAITITKSRHSVTSGSASDTLTTISGSVSGDILYLCGTAGKTITVDDGAVNIECGSDRTLDGVNDWMTLIYDGSKWQLLSISLDN